MKNKALYLRALQHGVPQEVLDAISMTLTRKGPNGRVWHYGFCRTVHTNAFRQGAAITKQMTLAEAANARMCIDCAGSDSGATSALREALAIASLAADTGNASSASQAEARLRSWHETHDTEKHEPLGRWIDSQIAALPKRYDDTWVVPLSSLVAALARGGSDRRRTVAGEGRWNVSITPALGRLLGHNGSALDNWVDAMILQARRGNVRGVDIDTIDVKVEAADIPGMIHDISRRPAPHTWHYPAGEHTDPIAWLKAEWEHAVRDELRRLQRRVLRFATIYQLSGWTLAIGSATGYGLAEEALNVVSRNYGMADLGGWHKRRLVIIPIPLAMTLGFSYQDWQRVDRVGSLRGAWKADRDEAVLLETVATLLEDDIHAEDALTVARQIFSTGPTDR